MLLNSLFFLLLSMNIAFGDINAFTEAANATHDDDHHHHRQANVTSLWHNVNCKTEFHQVMWIFNTEQHWFGDRITSLPRCYDKNRQLITRQCSLTGWLPKQTPHCAFVEDDYDEPSVNCPTGYVDLKWGGHHKTPLCVLLTPPQPWSNTCMLSGSSKSLFDLTKYGVMRVAGFLNYKNITKFWLPAKTWRNQSEELYWVIPFKYGEAVDDTHFSILQHQELNDDNKTGGGGGGCLQVTLDAGTTKAYGHIVSCTELYPILCIYHDQTLLSLACESNDYLMPRYYSKNPYCYAVERFNCISLSTSEEYDSGCDGDLLSMDTVNNIQVLWELGERAKLTDTDRCLYRMKSKYTTGRTRGGGANLTTELADFNATTNSSPRFILEDDDDYITCAICQKEIVWPDSIGITLQLKSENTIILKIKNEKYLLRNDQNDSGVYCFTEISGKVVKLLIKSKGISSDEKHEYDVANIGPSNYWCEAIYLKNYNVIRSNTINIKGNTFAMHVFSLKCNNNTHAKCNGLQVENDFIEFLQTNQAAQSSDSIIKIKEVEMVDVITTAFRLQGPVYIFHVTVQLKNNFTTREPNNINLTEPFLTIYYMRQELQQLVAVANENFSVTSVRCTKYCLPQSISILKKFNWSWAKIGDIKTSIELCLSSNNMPVVRQCAGNDIVGGIWVNVTNDWYCSANIAASFITRTLHDITTNFVEINQTVDVLDNVRAFVINETEHILPADVFFISQIVDRALYLCNSSFSNDEFIDLFRIFNGLMKLNENVTRSSAQLNSTNNLLCSYDRLIKSLSKSSEHSFSWMMTNRLLTISTEPSANNITGVALYRPRSTAFDENNLHTYEMNLLFQNQSVEGIVNDSRLAVASFIPQSLWEQISQTKQPPSRVLITVFLTDVLFHTSQSQGRANNMIISISLLGYNTSDLPEEIPIMFNGKDAVRGQKEDMNSCGFWDFDSESGWSVNGCRRQIIAPSSNNNILCKCNHLTNFAFIIHGHLLLKLQDEYALNLITIIGSSLSLLGVFGILLTAVMFRRWRQKLSVKFLIQFSSAIGLQMGLLCIINIPKMVDVMWESTSHFGCIIFGALLHYSVLVVFIWMLIIAYLQFMRYVIVFEQVRSAHFLLKLSSLGWGLPSIPVILVLAIDTNLYISSDMKVCYPRGNALFYSSVLPIVIIVVANLIIFSLVVYNLRCRNEQTTPSYQMDTQNVTMLKLRFSVFLFFLLGLNWILGFLSPHYQMGLILSYLFCLTATVQGLVLFCYFIVLNPVARSYWMDYLRTVKCLKLKDVHKKEEDKIQITKF